MFMFKGEAIIIGESEKGGQRGDTSPWLSEDEEEEDVV